MGFQTTPSTAAKRKYGGMEIPDARRLKQLEEENRQLKRIVADQALNLQVVKDLLGESGGLRVKRRLAVTEAGETAQISERRACRFTGFAISTRRYRSRRASDATMGRSSLGRLSISGSREAPGRPLAASSWRRQTSRPWSARRRRRHAAAPKPVRLVPMSSRVVGSGTVAVVLPPLKPPLPKSLLPEPKSPPLVQSFEMTLLCIVTSPWRAMALPHKIFAPVVMVMSVSARILPWNSEPVPSVAELPTCQYTPLCGPPLSTDTVELLAVVSVLPI